MNKDKEVEAYKSGNLTPEEQTKYEIAQELGILDKVLEGGWKSLSAKETVLIESRFGMPLEFVDIHIQPDRFAEIKFIANLIQSIENLVGSCIVAVITDGGVFDHMIVFKFFSP